MTQILILGFGEAGQAFAKGWSEADCALTVRSYDRILDTGDTELAGTAARFGVQLVAHNAEGFAGVDHVFSLVTADQAIIAAERAAPHLGPGQVFWDLNSVAPQTKRAAAHAITARGALYIDVGVLSPVYPKLHRSPLALAGPVDKVQAAVAEMDLQAEPLSAQVGDAAALKLLRSVVIKGIEGLILECVEGGRATGLTEKTLASLAPSFPGIDWQHRAGYVLERVANHGARRAAEMREAVTFLDGVGVAPTMARAAAERLEKGVPGDAN
ncbi:MAG: DUF1932 domain-containing protein [Pseudomonadota bacterium]